MTTDCPCGSGVSLAQCCGPILDGVPAPTAEALMRSRYTAHVHRNVDYLLATWAPEMRATVDRAHVARWAAESTWLGLTIVECARGGARDVEGIVEFKARYRLRGKVQIHHERSRFRRDKGRWYYIDGNSPGSTSDY